MTGSSNYAVASADTLRGQNRASRIFPEKSTVPTKEMDFALTPRPRRKSVRFTPSTSGGSDTSSEVDRVGFADIDIFTQSSHVSYESQSSLEFQVSSLPTVTLNKAPAVAYLLQPVAYSPGQGSGNLSVPHRVDSPLRVKETVAKIESYASPTRAYSDGDSPPLTDLRNNSPRHERTPSNTPSISSRRGHKNSSLDIYFTPVDVTKSQVALSSPVSSPDFTPSNRSTSLSSTSIPDDRDCPTPRASMRLSRPPSEIYVGGFQEHAYNKDAFLVTPAQLNQLVIGLAKTELFQGHVRGWWDVEDVPDDESIVSSFSNVSLPTLTSASTLYSRQNETFLGHVPQSVQQVEAQLNAPSGGVALCDSKAHGAPVRFVTRAYRKGRRILNVGSCTHLRVLDGADMDCTLRIERADSSSTSCRVVLQCVVPVVDRKTGKTIYLLDADIDVTERFTRAALAELAEATGKNVSDICITTSSTPNTPSASTSPDIDWVAIADELQAASDVSDTVDNALVVFAGLDRDTCAMASRTLLAYLDRVQDQHRDLLVLRPTSFHPNGTPAQMRVPYLSKRLYEDWYEGASRPGYSDVARDFQTCIIANVSKRHFDGEEFGCEAFWGEVKQSIRCVPLVQRDEQTVEAWACFVRGEYDLD